MKKLLVSLALLLVVAYPAFGALDGSVSGVVKDSSGGVLPGVSVLAKSPVLQGTRTAVTRNDGTYRLPSLPPGGGYTIEFALSGFKTVSRSGIAVRLSEDTQINPVMQLADVQTEVVVTGETPVVDTTQTNTAQNFTNEHLRKLPIGSATRSYQSILAQAPGVVGTGNPNVNGGNILENSFMVDGINTTDPVTHTFSFNMNFDAIQEVSVQTSGFGAEYGRATGGIVNVVTKSGGNEFSGSFDVRYNSFKLADEGDYYDPDFTPFRSTPWGVTLGGPIVKDRLWFFGNLSRGDNYSTPATANTVILSQNPNQVARRFDGWNDGLKLSFNLSDKLNGFVNFTDAQARIPGAINSTLYRPEAMSTQTQRAQILNLKLNGILSDSWIGELQVGQSNSKLETGPTSGDLATSTWTNRTQGSVRYDNYNNFQRSNRDRTQAGVNSTYFLGGFAGNHEFKAGFDLDRTKFPSLNFTTGTPSDPAFCSLGATPGAVCGATFTFNGFDASGARVPYQQSISERTPQVERSGKSYAAYFQDQWRPTPRLTVNLGVRWDKTQYLNNVDLKIIDFDKFQPRLSVAYDLLGDGKTVARANYGQFYAEPGLTAIRGADTGIYSPYSAVYNWVAAQGKWVLDPRSVRGGVAGGVLTGALIDPDLKPTYDEQINVAVEREVMRNLSVTATYIYKKTKDIFEDTCTDQENCPDFWITNWPGKDLGLENPLTKDYYGYQFQIDWRLPNGRGIVNASYVYSKSRGSTDAGSTQYIGADFDVYPYNFVNMYGYLGDDARNRIKVNASYRIPYIETDFGVAYTYRSGFAYNDTRSDPYGGTEFVLPRGTSRGPIAHNFDLQLEKTFNIGFPTNVSSVSVVGSVFNLLSRENVTSIGGTTTSTTYKQPLSYSRPRSYELGFRIDF